MRKSSLLFKQSSVPFWERSSNLINDLLLSKEQLSTKDEKTPEEIYAEFQKTYYNDPVGFVRDCINWGDGEGFATYQSEIAQALITHKRVAVRGPRGLGKCLGCDEDVELADGTIVFAKDLIGKTFQVIAVDHELKRYTATAVAANNGVYDVVEITTDKGRKILRTLQHPLWADVAPYRWDTIRCSKQLRPQPSWIAAGELVPGATVTIKLGQDGQRHHAISDEAIKLAPYSLKVWGGGGKSSHKKRFPLWIWALSNTQLALFLSRLFGADGWVYTSKRLKNRQTREIGYCSVNEGLARDVSKALLRLHIHAELRWKKTSWTYKNIKKTSGAWTVSVHDVENIRLFAKNIGVFGKEKKLERLLMSCNEANEGSQQKWRTWNLPDGYRWEKVKEVRLLRDVPTVIISVPKYETFLTEFVEHNSAEAAILTHWFFLTRDGQDWKVITTASAWRQLSKFLWPEIHKWAKRINWPKIGRRSVIETGELLIEQLRGRTGSAFPVASDNAALIEGAHADKIFYIFDESKEISDAVFDSAEGTLSSIGARPELEAFALAISTPGEPIGRFYDIHKRKPGFEDWWVRHVRKEEVIAARQMGEVWAEARKRQWGEESAMYQNHVEGEFFSSDKSGIIPLSWIEKANNRWNEWKESARGYEHLDAVGVDVAGQGKDKTVIACRSEQTIVELRKYEKQDTMATAGVITGIIQKYGGKAIVDTVGLGAGVGDKLKENEVSYVGFNNGAKAIGKNKSGELGFTNKYSEGWWNLRELLDPTSDNKVALPPDEELMQELMTPHYRYKGEGKIDVENKDDNWGDDSGRTVKQRLGRSPDSAEAVVMAYYSSELSYGFKLRPVTGF